MCKRKMRRWASGQVRSPARSQARGMGWEDENDSCAFDSGLETGLVGAAVACGPAKPISSSCVCRRKSAFDCFTVAIGTL